MALSKPNLENYITNILEFVVHRYYNNPTVREKALSKIPLELLKENAQQNLMNNDPEISLLRELMCWFTTFFKWIDTPECSNCGAPRTVMTGYSNEPDHLIQTNRVEVYRCNDCNERVLFPRYNNPEILLDNPRGRCGEWANVFTLFCIAIGLDARYVFDVTDHVWTEVYSKAAGRWIHCDVCEVAIDSPLMYENGWKKKLSYVIAFSVEEVQDVTWRYTQFYDTVLERRKNKCDEKTLISLIMGINKEREKFIDPARYQFVLERRVVELAEFITPPVLKDNYGGRRSGSLNWRMSRNEYVPNPDIMDGGYVWTPEHSEIISKCFSVAYCTATDKYMKDDKVVVSKWLNGVSQSRSVFRKAEKDWNMAYLCRTEGSKEGIIRWKFDLLHLKKFLKISVVMVRYTSSLFKNGLIKWMIESDKVTIDMDSDKEYFETEKFEGESWFILTARMLEGEGTEAWQHSQILRQDLRSTECPLCITVTLDTRT